MKVPIDNAWWVVPGRLLASPFPGSPDRDEADRRYKALLAAGIRRFISLQPEDEIGRGGEPFPSYGPRIAELAAIDGHGVTFLRFPVADLSVPTQDQMAAILNAINEGLEREQAVIVHCWGGHGRTGAVMGCFLREQGCGPDEALARITELRAHNEFLRSQPAPQTAAQIAMVRGWKR